MPKNAQKIRRTAFATDLKGDFAVRHDQENQRKELASPQIVYNSIGAVEIPNEKEAV